MPGLQKRSKWFLKNNPELAKTVRVNTEAHDGHDHAHSNSSSPALAQADLFQLAIPSADRLKTLLRSLFDEGEFLSEFGFRSLSKYHENNPFVIEINNEQFRCDYAPAEGTTSMFGGNSNWRGGPCRSGWISIIYLLFLFPNRAIVDADELSFDRRSRTYRQL